MVHRSSLSSSKVLSTSQYFRAVYALNVMQLIKTTVFCEVIPYFTLLSISTSGRRKLSGLLTNLIWFVISTDLGTQSFPEKNYHTFGTNVLDNTNVFTMYSIICSLSWKNLVGAKLKYCNKRESKLYILVFQS